MKNRIILLTCITISVAAEGNIGGITFFDFSFYHLEDSTAFNFNRQYFSYTGEAAENIKYQIVFDVSRTNVGGAMKEKGHSYISEDTRLVVFLKKA